MGIPGMEGGVPLPYLAAGPWVPPGIVPPWPTNEYLRDGGANPPGVAVAKNGAVLGLEMEDTVAKFKTLDGQTRVEPSNKVVLYSPRFCAVRQVVERGNRPAAAASDGRKRAGEGHRAADKRAGRSEHAGLAAHSRRRNQSARTNSARV